LGIADIIAAGAKAIADGAAKAATTTKTTTAPKATSAPKAAVSTVASKTVTPLPTNSSQGLKLVNQIIAGEKPPVEIKQEQPIMGPPALPGYAEQQKASTYSNESSGRIGLSEVATVPIITQSELQQEIQQKTQETVSQIEFQQKGIIPSAQYSVEGRATPIPGFIVNLELEGQKKQAISQGDITTNKISSYPTGTTFQKSREGYNVILPVEDRYADVKKEFEKIDNAYKVNPVLGFVAELGYGAVSSGEALLATGQNLLSKTGIVQPNTKYYPSLWDIGFEREGMKTWGKRPVFTAGSVFGEILQFYAGGELVKPIISGGKILVKGVSKKVFTISLLKGTAETTVLESGRTIANPISKGVSRFIPGAIKESSTIKNFERWAIEGYKPGKTLVEVPIKGGVQGEFNIQQFALKTDKSVPLLERRIWLSPKEQTEIAARLAKQGAIEGSVTIRPLGKYSQKLTIAADKESFETGLTGTIKKRTATTFLKEEVLGTELGTAKGGSGGFGGLTKIDGKLVSTRYGKEIVAPGIDVGIKPTQESLFKTMMEKGFTREIPLESGKINISGFSGFGKQTAPILERSQWKTSLLSKQSFRNFAKNIKASATTLVSIQKSPLILRESRALSSVTMNVASDVFGKALLAGTKVGIVGASKIGIMSYTRGEIKKTVAPEININQISKNKEITVLPRKSEIQSVHQEVDLKLNQITKPSELSKYSATNQISEQTQKQNRISIPERITIPESIKVQIPETEQEQEYYVRQNQVQEQKQEQVQIKLLAQRQEQMQKLKNVTIKTPSFKQIKEKIVIPPPILLPSGLYGRGIRGSAFSLFEEKYRFRGVNKFDPMKELNKMKVNIKGLNAMKTKVKT
jgi:hypothetical protein